MGKISTKESIALIVTLVINNIVLVSSQIIQETCSSASLLNSIYVSIIALIFAGILCLLYKKFIGLDILDISKYLGGKILMWIVGIVFFAYYLFKVSILLRRIVDCLQIVYYPYTNILYIVLLFLIAAGIICGFKNSSISKANYIFIPIVLASLVVVFAGNIRNFDFNAIYPLLGNNVYSTFFSGLSNLVAFSGLAYILFIPSSMKEPHKFNKVAIWSVVISSIFLIMSVATILFMFSNVAADSELFPLYLAVRHIEFGSFLQRLDAAFLLIWSISFISLLCIVTNLCVHIFKKITNLSDKKPIIYPVILCIFGISLLIKNNSLLWILEHNIFKILFFAVIVAFTSLILILANIKKILKKGEINE